MFFWGPITGPGAVTKKVWLLRYATVGFIFFTIGLEPDGCLVADQLQIRTENF